VYAQIDYSFGLARNFCNDSLESGKSVMISMLLDWNARLKFMNTGSTILPGAIVFALSLPMAPIAPGADPPERLPRELPAGLHLKSSKALSTEDLKVIGERLGGKIERLTQSVLQVHGSPIQVNVITAADELNATAIHSAISRLKPDAFSVRKEHVVIEYVGNDAGLATKTSWELGLIEKPQRVRYRVTAEVATVEKADYMSCNPLFNQFLLLRNDAPDEVVQRIQDLSGKFTFGRSLVLRNPGSGKESATYRFEPAATAADGTGATVAYSFPELPNRHGVPRVTAVMDITADSTGLLETSAVPAKELTAATPFWPAEDAEVKALAQQVTRGHTTNEAKAAAILEWLGKNMKNSGPTGSRWGTKKALGQKFGHCWDSADCFVTLSRAAGVPARQVAGWLYGSSGHVWAEFYLEGRGWQQVDPAGGGVLRCGIYHIPWFTSESGEMPILYVSMPRIEATPVK
jgi:hypothetical protein